MEFDNQDELLEGQQFDFFLDYQDSDIRWENNQI